MCIQCDNPKKGLFTKAWQLVGETVGNANEEDNFDDDEFWKGLAEAGHARQGHNVLRIEAANGNTMACKQLESEAREKNESAVQDFDPCSP